MNYDDAYDDAYEPDDPKRDDHYERSVEAIEHREANDRYFGDPGDETDAAPYDRPQDDADPDTAPLAG